jgi:hypothetical protein
MLNVIAHETGPAQCNALAGNGLYLTGTAKHTRLKQLITLCYRDLMRTLIALLALAFTLTAPSFAQMQRLLPTNGKLGHLVGQQHPVPLVEIDSKVLRVSPGGVIVDQNNRFIVHGALPAAADVLYVLDSRGDISRIILLTPTELARLEQAAKR